MGNQLDHELHPAGVNAQVFVDDFLLENEVDHSEAEVAARYFAAFAFLASARRSVFFRRLARFFTLSLPRLCPISLNLRPLVATWQRDETEAGVCAVAAAAFDVKPALAHPELV